MANIYPNNVTKSIVESSSPVVRRDLLSIYYHYIKERNSVYINKEILHKQYPWTDDPIIRDNSFTCCKRWLDRTSRWLIDKISNNTVLDLNDRIWRTIIFRLYNKIDTAVLIQLNSYHFWDNIDKAMDNLDKLECDPFTRAYKVIGMKYYYREDSGRGYENWRSSLLWHINDIRNNEFEMLPWLINGIISPKEIIKLLKNSTKGLGNFIAYQIYIDLTYINDLDISEDEFVMSGPGCSAGLDMLFEDKDGMSDEELLFWMRDNIDSLFKSIDSNYDTNKFFYYLDSKDRRWTVMDIENSFCEFSKYIYIKEGRHRKPRKYNPR